MDSSSTGSEPDASPAELAFGAADLGGRIVLRASDNNRIGLAHHSDPTVVGYIHHITPAGGHITLGSGGKLFTAGASSGSAVTLSGSATTTTQHSFDSGFQLAVLTTDGSDTVFGTDAGDTFEASPLGDDTYYGGLGYNTVSYGALDGVARIVYVAGAPAAGLYGLGTGTVVTNGKTDTLVDINEVIGTAGADVLSGVQQGHHYVSTRMRGDGGNDTINGFRTTYNVADYSTATAAVTVDLQQRTDQDGNWIGSASGDSSVGTDTLVNVLNIRASNFDDTMWGGVAGDVFQVNGVSGSHTFFGRGGQNQIRFTTGDAIDVIIDLGTTSSGTGYGGYLGTMTKPAAGGGTVVDLLFDFYVAQGGGGNDTIRGTPVDDILAGGLGENLIDGRGGMNWVTYRLNVGQGLPELGVTVDLTQGTATNYGGGTDTLVNIQHAIGTQFADNLTGLSVAGTRTYLRGEGGDDTLIAGSPDTMITADYLTSVSGVLVDLGAGVAYDDGWFGGTDTLINIQGVSGSAFGDVLMGGAGADWLSGNQGNDDLFGSEGDDTLIGGAGNDYLEGDAGADLYTGGLGADRFSLLVAPTEWLDSTLAAMDVVTDFSITEGDTLQISDFDGMFNGLAGRKALLWQGTLAAQSTLALGLALPGQGLSPVAYSAAWVPDTTGDGWLVLDSDGDGLVGADDFVARLDAATALAIGSANFIAGTFTHVTEASADADSLLGDVEADFLSGGAGADTLLGSFGDDTLVGGTGDDWLVGGIGDDSYLVDSQADVIFENAGGGTDTVATTASFYLYAHIETLILAEGAGDFFGVGNAEANLIIGNAGANLILGMGDDDSIFGRAGNDILYGGDGDDSMEGGAGIDYLIGGIGNDTLNGGDDADVLYGEDGDDSLTGGGDFVFDMLVGGDGNDTLDGASGHGDYDYLYGGAGDDVFYVDTPHDLVFEFAGEGNDMVFADISGAGYYLYQEIENLTLLGTTPFGVGNVLDNTITGSAAANWLLGGAGDDTLNGMGGDDVLFGEAGADTFVFETGTGIDTIGDFASGEDHILLAGLGFASFDQVQAATSVIGSNSAINLGHGDFIVLLGVTSLAEGDLLFG